ncbi:MAG TPA: serine hydrolase [Nocardia sp.]|uniref:serine hydrolase n=1 Tax=Nocardia sp. TaxID=1821 RepID=UPI002B4B4E41|nr:serine hydrolase [Nocardia sp.]HLS79367.1 serine hydrolase [Nocardia sp.]
MRRRGCGVVAGLVVAGLVAGGCTVGEDGADSPAPPSASTRQHEVSPNAVAGVAIPEGQIDRAVGELDRLAGELMADSGIPGMAVAVVHHGEVVYSKGFGVRDVTTGEPVGASTVFQLASVSKPLGATVVARRVGAGGVSWDTPIRELTPDFALADPYVSDHVTVGDLYAHRSGLPDHAGDLLEDLGYDRTQVLERLRQLPLAPFRDSYAYTNFGLTAAAVAVAERAGTDWATLAERELYQPLGMNDTSSRYADFVARRDRAVGHVLVDGAYRPADPPRDPDPQSPAGGASSSVRDMARWLAMLLGDGTFEGAEIVPAAALLPAISPQSVSAPPADPDSRAGFYGYGFNVGTSAAGRVVLGHSGAFNLGAGTAFTAIPSAEIGIVTLTNAAATGIPETLNAEFADLVQFGEIREDWRELYRQAFEQIDAPSGELVGKDAPADPAPARPLTEYAGSYGNSFFGPAAVEVRDEELVVVLGPARTTLPLRHWDGDTFVFTPTGEMADPGTVSKATFDGDRLVLEYYDRDGLGTFTRT